MLGDERSENANKETKLGKDIPGWGGQLSVSTWAAHCCHISCVLPVATRPGEVSAVVLQQAHFSSLRSRARQNARRSACLPPSWPPKAQGGGGQVTPQLPLNCLVLFAAPVCQVRLFDCVTSPGITFSFTEKQGGWNSPL